MILEKCMSRYEATNTSGSTLWEVKTGKSPKRQTSLTRNNKNKECPMVWIQWTKEELGIAQGKC